MFWSKTFIPTLKEVPQEAESISHQLMLRAGLIRMLVSGVYSYLPLGLTVLENVERIIRQEMDATGANELLLPALQPQELWVRSGRDKDIGEVMIRFTDRKGRKLCLGPTHEEVITELVKNHVSSYKQLPLVLYQIQTKFRDEMRPRFGLVRGCEFIMKDAYSFDADEAGLSLNYDKMYKAYHSVFKRCGLQVIALSADSGVMGGKVSHEFMVPAASGEDMVLLCGACKEASSFKEEGALCPKCGQPMQKTSTIEIGHIFQLGTKYSQALGAHFLDAKGKQQVIIMGCYGIGVSRLLPTIIEQNHDESGIIWPEEVAPYKAVLLPLDINDEKIMGQARSAYEELTNAKVLTLLDDRDERPGVKFKDADLIGIPYQVVIGKEFLKSGRLELKIRRGNTKMIDTADSVINRLKSQTKETLR